MSLPAARIRAKNMRAEPWRIKFEHRVGCQNPPGFVLLNYLRSGRP
jgi:hypothetical protein